MSNKKRLFIDFDGTLVDVAPRHYAVYAAVINNFKGTVLPQTKYWKMKRDKIQWADILVASNLSPSLKNEFLNEFRKKIESFEYLRDDTLFPGVEELLKKLQRHHQLFLVSLRRKPGELHKQIDLLGIKSYFVHILSGHSENDGSDTKQELIKQYLEKYEKAAIIGDTEADILTGKELGLMTIAVTSGIRSERFLADLKPDHVVSRITDIEPYLR